jgi:hypothetical protein
VIRCVFVCLQNLVSQAERSTDVFQKKLIGQFMNLLEIKSSVSWDIKPRSPLNVKFQRTTRRYSHGDRSLHKHRCENLKSSLLEICWVEGSLSGSYEERGLLICNDACFCWFLACVTLLPWGWRRYIPPKSRALSEMHDVITQTNEIMRKLGFILYGLRMNS